MPVWLISGGFGPLSFLERAMRDKTRKIPSDFDQQFKSGESMGCGIAGTVSMKTPSYPKYNRADWEMREVNMPKTTRCSHKDDGYGEV